MFDQLRSVFLSLGLVLCVSSAQAQFQIKGGTFNTLRQAGVPTDPGSTPTTPQFAGHGATMGTAGPISTDAEHYDQYPAGKQVDGVTVTGGMVLIRASVGGAFASGVPRYSLGDEILPPAIAATEEGTAPFGEIDASYWRVKPVDYGEEFINPGSPTPIVELPFASVTVEGSKSDSNEVTLASGQQVSVGGTLLGRQVLVVNGEEVTLAGDADQTISSATAVDYAPPHNYYYSPHAKRVFAHQAGRVTVKWVTAQPVAADGDPNGAGAKEFRFKEEIFGVSSGSTRPVRTIYWTERSFNGPKVSIPTGRIVTVNPVYNAVFPQKVAEEYQGVGVVPADPNASPPAELRTLWFENTAGLGQLRAFNREGRVLVEYLGALDGVEGNVHEFLGADIVEVRQAATIVTATVNLGEQIQAHNASGMIPDNADQLIPSSVLNLNQDGVTYYGTSTRADGKLVYHAEWENDSPDKVTFYWLEEGDASIHFLPEPTAPNLGIAWPIYLNKYLQAWPGGLDQYAGVTVTDTGSTTATGIQFSGGTLPEVIHQDDGSQTEVSLDLPTQRLVVDFTQSVDKTNRSLLKFSSGSSVWYQRFYIQSQSVLGSPEVPEMPDPDGDGPLEGTPYQPAVQTLTDRNADGIRDLSTEAGAIGHEVVVGQRIAPPSQDYALAGYISEGTGYLPSAYQDPFVAGVEAAEAGAIIPVNAKPGDDEFTIWWFEEVEPVDDSFESFYVPAVSGRYTVSYPDNADQIVMASNKGTGDLSPAQAAGTIYYQNDPSQPGCNPNEEHALMLAGRAYALRDDLNITSGAEYSSEPFVLIPYEDPVDLRPALKVFEVLREDFANDERFDYSVNAGQQIPAPMPLPLLPPPLDENGNLKNLEVAGVQDPAPDRSGPVARYDKFTYEDRKGYSWVYRGPHDGSTANETRVSNPFASVLEGFDLTGTPGKAVYSHSFVNPFPSGTPVIDLSASPGWTEDAGTDAVGFSASIDFQKVDAASSTDFNYGLSTAIIDGRPAIAWKRQFDLLYVRANDAQGTSWGPVRTVAVAFNEGWYCSLAEVDGRPAIVHYVHKNSSLASAVEYVIGTDADGTSWETPVPLEEGLVGGPFYGGFPHLLVVGGRPAVAYEGLEGETELRYIRANDVTGTSWGGVQVIASGARYRFGFAVVDGLPAICYYLGGRTKFKRALDVDGLAWGDEIDVGPYEAASYLAQFGMAVIDGRPAISYLEEGEIVYVRALDSQGATWGTPRIAANGLQATTVGRSRARMIEYEGRPVISFFNGAELMITAASDSDGTAWTEVEVEALNITDLAKDRPLSTLVEVDGLVSIGYGNKEDGSVKFARIPSSPQWTAQVGPGTSMGMQFYYAMQESFHVPGVATQPAVGEFLPYLRPLVGGVPQEDEVTGTPLTVIYRPSWPEQAPELRVAETLTLPKFGLPQVRGQSSAEVLYQQSIANSGKTATSVTLHDPTRAKKTVLSDEALDIMNGKDGKKGEILTTLYNGRTYFQRLPPHLQQRVYANPILGGEIELVLEGEFVDEIAGEDYLNLNVLSVEDVASLKGLDNDPGSKWDEAVDALVTQVETFEENSTLKGTYKVKSSVAVGEKELAVISDSDTAVDSYALTATGQGTGYVSLLFADGEAFTPEGDPISIGVIKVAPQLYVGDMKVQFSSNPLDEQVTLRHSGDFGAKPEDYEFEWRYAPLSDGLPPATYAYDPPAAVLDNSTMWTLVQNPAGALPTAAEYAAGTSVTVPRSLTIQDENHTVGSGLPGIVMGSDTAVDFTGGIPAQIIFSASLSEDLDGFVVYVNGSEVLGFRAPEAFASSNAATDLSATGLPFQFDLSPNFFSAGSNTVEVALYSAANAGVTSQVNFRLETVSRTDRVDDAVYPSSPWQHLPQQSGSNYPWSSIVTTGGSPTAPLGDPLLLLQDNAFTVRYRPKSGTSHVLAGDGWSDWMDAQVVPGWVKRVLDGINPYGQRVTDLFNNAVNTDVSILTQAGTRWEGDIALNLDNVNDAGLIEIYETVLNRAKNFSIDNGYDVPGVNDALLLAAGYLNDLYIILGNEAYADAANPTISLDDQDTITEVNTSRFSFEGQVASSLEEELSLYRGRDDFLATSVSTAPAYNRLYWNYTNGIDSGEVLYAVNYNIKEKVGSATQDGVIDAADAQRMFPQAHGDAYGHYLTALKGYYRLLTNDNFTWTPRSEVVLVLGQNVSVDYYDERKFAGAASNLARTAEQILSLTWRQAYRDDESAGWEHFRDNKLNARTTVRRQFGVDEWASRSTSGAYLNWLAGNAMLPEEDTNPQHEGIQIVDRQTVPELAELAAAGSSLQAIMDNANAHLNPLGLSPDAIAFDLSPGALKAGTSHFEQVYGRALSSVLNAKGSFDQAGRMTRLLRNQDNQIDDYNTTIEEQERAFNYKLIDLFGTPYSADIGVGKTYAQGYAGPDLLNWRLVDRPTNFKRTNYDEEIEVIVPSPKEVVDYDFFYNLNSYDDLEVVYTKHYVDPYKLGRIADTWSSEPMGSRAVVGEIQQALTSVDLAHLALVEAADVAIDEQRRLELLRDLLREQAKFHLNTKIERREAAAERLQLTLGEGALGAAAEGLSGFADSYQDFGFSIAEGLPTSLGFSNDVTAPVRGTLKTSSSIVSAALRVSSIAASFGAKALAGIKDGNAVQLLQDVEALEFAFEEKQLFYEYAMQYEEMLDLYIGVEQRALELQRAAEHARNVMARGDRILAEREIFRLRAAAIIQGYRTRDVAFRAFRNEALEQYRTLFDLGARYTYLAAKSYDYETGLLGTPEGEAAINQIVASRALGDLSNGQPQASTSVLGDPGLAGTMAQLVADFAVAEGRLGINNPDQNGTLFSLRRELFRLPNDPDSTEDDDQWQQTLEQHMVSDLMSDSDAATYCRSLSHSGGGRVPGIIIPFSTTIADGYNWFGLPLAGGDHAFSESNFATKVYSVGMVLKGYTGMDPYAFGTPDAGEPEEGADTLSATPYVYLIPTGTDFMRAPAFGDTGEIRTWDVQDQALPLPYNLGNTDFNGTQFFNTNGTLSEQPWVIRKHQAFRPVSDPAFFYSRIPDEFTSSRLVGRSVWNSGWKIVIPAYTLMSNEEEGLERFVRSVGDIQIFLRTYSNSGN